MADMKGKKVAHTSPSSNSGHMAPMALFPKEGLAPEKDYKVLFSGKHDQSVMGVKSGDYDGAAVASDVFYRMAARGQINKDDFRILYTSPKFPTSSFAYAHDLEPGFRDKMLACFYDYRYPAAMQKAFDGADRFYPVTYEKDWAIVRQVAEAGGEKFNRAAYDREAEKAKAKATFKVQVVEFVHIVLELAELSLELVEQQGRTPRLIGSQDKLNQLNQPSSLLHL
jgi:phosphonate transport system substrate-binding protein